MRKICFGAIAAFTALACNAEPRVDQSALRAAMSDVLKDSDSAKFKDIKVKQDGGIWLICGQVNSKNAYGGYPGFSQFLIMGLAPPAGRPIKTLLSPTLGEVAELRCDQLGISP